MATLLSYLMSTHVLLQCLTLPIELTLSMQVSGIERFRVSHNGAVGEQGQDTHMVSKNPYGIELQSRPLQKLTPDPERTLMVKTDSKEDGTDQGKGQIKQARPIEGDDCNFCSEYIKTHSFDQSSGSKNCKCNKTARSCDCQSCNLTSIPGDLPWDITMLNLFNNSITSEGLCYLKVYTSLMRLNLDKNLVSYLNVCFFRGLQSLQSLNLRNNSLWMRDKNFPPGTFAPLTSLKYLKINKNNPDPKQKFLNYPDAALSDLTNLETLEMDGLRDKTFGKGFRQMRNLRYLLLAGYYTGYCDLGIITNKTFENVPNLTYLNISDCLLVGKNIASGSFAPLKKISVIDLNYNELTGIDDLARIMSGLKHSSLQYLNVGDVISRFSTAIHLNKTHLRNFPQSLRQIRAVRNGIETVSGDFFDSLPSNLTHLDVSSNKFIFGWYLMNLSRMANLETLDLNGGSYLYAVPRNYPFSGPKMQSSSFLYAKPKQYPISRPKMQDLSFLNSQSHDLTNYEGKGNEVKFVLELPPKLKTVKMNNAGLQYRLTYLKVNEANSLERLEMDQNNFPDLVGPFVGLIHLKYISIAGSFVQSIQPDFFSNLSTLTTLRLYLNLLGDFFANNPNISVFQNLSNLRVLDLSKNSISKVGNNIFAGLSNLRELHLKGNRFENFDVDISHMTKLEKLDLSQNTISTLTIAVIDHIDLLVNHTHNISVKLSFNPIACTCQNLNFLKWMVQSKAFDHRFKHYKCMYSDTSVRYIDDAYKETIERLSKECISNKLLLLIVSLVIILVLIVIVCAVLYRLRWKLRYIYYVSHLWFKGNRDNSNASHFEYDVFTSYASEDVSFVVHTLEPELERRGLKMLVHERDFATGDYIASNIVNAVMKSKKTLVVLTKNLLASTWCNYELQMANEESVQSGRQVLVFLIKERIQASEMSYEFLYHIRNNTYIEYPNGLDDGDITTMERFWDRLSGDLKNC